MTSRPDEFAVMTLIMKDERETAEQQLNSALKSLPPIERYRAIKAFAEIAQLDRIASIAQSRDVNRRSTEEGDASEPSGNAEDAFRSDAKKPPTAEADVWLTIAQMIGRKEVKAASVRTMAERAGTNFSYAQAARKLQNWVDGGVMERRGRGVFAFSEKGYRRYNIDESAETAG